MGNNEEGEELSKKINVIISLLNDIKNQDRRISLKENIAYFDKLGLSNKDIAKILSISEKHVSKEKSLMRKKKNE